MPKPKQRKKKEPKVHPNRQWCLDQTNDETMLFADGFDDCIMGVEDGLAPRVVYDKQMMIEELMSQGLEEVEAIEYLEFNTWGAYVGEQTPLYIYVRS
jgi:hypothetical protein